MCLRSVMKKQDRDKLLKEIGKEGLKVYKVVRVENGKYYPMFNEIDTPFNEGIMEAKTDVRERIGYSDKRYNVGFHFWFKRKAADKIVEGIKYSQEMGNTALLKQFRDAEVKVITCIVKKSWITIMGLDRTDGLVDGAVVAKKAIFPKFRG